MLWDGGQHYIGLNKITTKYLYHILKVAFNISLSKKVQLKVEKNVKMIYSYKIQYVIKENKNKK